MWFITSVTYDCVNFYLCVDRSCEKFNQSDFQGGDFTILHLSAGLHKTYLMHFHESWNMKDERVIKC